jgi:hypothetical protein
MSNYVKSTNFTAKDSLPTGDANKVIRGSEFDTEFNAIAVAVATKSNTDGPTFTGTVVIPTVDINGGAIDGTTVGSSSASTGNFTSLSINGTAITSTAAELNILDGVTSTTAELNILDGVTATFGEINLLDGSSAGTIVNSKSVIYGAAGEINATTLQIGGVSITSTATELNILDGVTSTTAELNILDGVTSTTAELNILDGVTSTASELNTLDGITSSTAELNILTGKAFLDEDDMSSNSATGIASQQSIKAYVDSQTGGGGATLAGLSDVNITSPADGGLLFYDTTTSKWIDNVVSGDITIADTGVASLATLSVLNVDNIQIDANSVKSTDTNGNIQLFPNGTGFTELYGNTNPGTIRFNCESNSHGVTVKGPAHSAAATYTVNLPDVLGTSAASTLVTASATSKVTLVGTTSLAEIIEKVNVDSSTSGTINFDFLSQAVHFYNVDQTANRTINFRGDGSTTLNSTMAAGESITTAVLMKQAGTAYYLNTFQIDGSSVTPEWQGGTAPSAGNTNSIDAYSFTIIKTADATFTVLAAQTKFA